MRHDILILYKILYGVALVSRIDKIRGLFCKRGLQKRRYSAKETYNFIDPTDRSHHKRDIIFIDMCHEILKSDINIRMGWLRSVGSIKLQVSFAEYRLFHSAVVQRDP